MICLALILARSLCGSPRIRKTFPACQPIFLLVSQSLVSCIVFRCFFDPSIHWASVLEMGVVREKKKSSNSVGNTQSLITPLTPCLIVRCSHQSGSFLRVYQHPRSVQSAYAALEMTRRIFLNGLTYNFF